MQSESTPYLSLVVTARNDDHGGSLLTRMQAFVNGWIGQCQRHGLSSELIVVDWNPPADRPPLMDAIRWPASTHPCDVRFIEVPREIHQRYKHAESLPLYQMIAKNVGIRRAHGKFVLATNIDIIFSDELVRHFAERRLDPGRMYRIDRHDVMSEVPVEGGVDEQMAYCRAHLIRVNSREGTFNLTPDGLRALSPEDIAAEDSGITFGAGWYGVEYEAPHTGFRWMSNNAEVNIGPAPPREPYLLFDLEPGPSAGKEPLRLVALDTNGRTLAEADIRSRQQFTVNLAGGPSHAVRLRVSGGGLPAPDDPRVLNLRAFQCGWANSAEVKSADSRFRKSPKNPGIWLQLMHALTRIGQEEPPVLFTLHASPRVRRFADFYIGVGGITGLLRGGLRRYRRRQVRPLTAVPPSKGPAESPEHLHTNACGDFTLMARDQWMSVRGYPEFDMYSFNIDSVLCYAAHYCGVREEVLSEPMRIYHIEHGTGSGWTPEGQAKLFDRLREKGIGWLDYKELVVWAQQMRRFHSPMIFNDADWGLAGVKLSESGPVSQGNCAANA